MSMNKDIRRNDLVIYENVTINEIIGFPYISFTWITYHWMRFWIINITSTDVMSKLCRCKVLKIFERKRLQVITSKIFFFINILNVCTNRSSILNGTNDMYMIYLNTFLCRLLIGLGQILVLGVCLIYLYIHLRYL
jgi:hypothetical protein